MGSTQVWMTVVYAALGVSLGLSLFVAGRHRSRGLRLVHELHRRWYDVGLPLHRVSAPVAVPVRTHRRRHPAQHRRAA